MIVTAVLTTRVVRISHGYDATVALIDEILATDHSEWETILAVGDVEFHQSRAGGPFPDHQFRVSVRPVSGLAAGNYTDNNDPEMPIADTWNPHVIAAAPNLIFNGSTGAVFAASSAIPIDDMRRALLEWIKTRKRPTAIHWRPHGFV